MITWEIDREQQTGLRIKSVFVLLQDNGAYRKFEAVGVPLMADAQQYITTHYTPADMWAQGVTATAEGQRKASLAAARAADASNVITAEEAEQANSVAVLKTIIRKLIIKVNRLQEELKP